MKSKNEIRIETINLTKENLKKIKKLDNSFYKEDILTLDWYLERYNENHKALVLVNEKNEWVGYLVSVPITKELYTTIINGVLVNDLYLNPKHFLVTSNYNYIVSVLISDKYRNKGYGKKLIKHFFEINNGKFCALSITKGGYNLCLSQMELWMKINETTFVFVKDK